MPGLKVSKGAEASSRSPAACCIVALRRHPLLAGANTLLTIAHNVCATCFILLSSLFLGGHIMHHRNISLFLLLGLALVATVWGREDRLTNTGVAPAAEGKIITDNDRNDNTGVQVQVKHMANPQSLTPPKQGYLVWVQPRGKGPELLGSLRVNENLEGSLKATTPYKQFDVLVTAEDTLKPDAPSSAVILRGSVERK